MFKYQLKAMEKTLSEQLSVFIWSCAFGVILGIFYDIFRFIRALGINSKVHVYIQDIIFMCFCSLLTFLFTAAFNKGEIRFFIVFGEFPGLLLYRYTIGEFTIRIFKLLVKIVKIIARVINRQIEKIKYIMKKSAQKIYSLIKTTITKLKSIKNKYLSKRQSMEEN